ncbi:5029_t:CDS:2 [Ambispora gerdemannii]|uniref:5029_t:CDS:1 n=1 Tax=Ambispora gerdemannii TaxID=144530 RepID=A0A9N8WLU4_9GLOM|nr:5029_t:CDS:2 [Ambispora gerdemannii]
MIQVSGNQENETENENKRKGKEIDSDSYKQNASIEFKRHKKLSGGTNNDDNKAVDATPQNQRPLKVNIIRLLWQNILNVRYIRVKLLMFMLLFIFGGYYYFNHNSGEQTFDHFADLPTKKIHKGTWLMAQQRIILNDLASLLKKNDVVPGVGDILSDKLKDLAKEMKEFGETIADFHYDALKFFKSIDHEMAKIDEILSKKISSQNAVIYIKQSLNSLESKVHEFQPKLKKVIVSSNLIEKAASNTNEDLADGEKEADLAIKKHWIGEINDYKNRIQSENVLRQIHFVMDSLKTLSHKLVVVDLYLNTYKRNLQDVKTELDLARANKEPTKARFIDLKDSIRDLKEGHQTMFDSNNKIQGKPSSNYDDHPLLDNKNGYKEKNRDCTEFKAWIDRSKDPKGHLFKKSYLKKLRIWYSDVIHAIAFFYDDDSVDIYGVPGDVTPHDFDWNQGERVKYLWMAFGSVIQGLEIETTSGRKSGWIGSGQDRKYKVYSTYGSIVGFHGSFSSNLCSLGILVI